MSETINFINYDFQIIKKNPHLKPGRVVTFIKIYKNYMDKYKKALIIAEVTPNDTVKCCRIYTEEYEYWRRITDFRPRICTEIEHKYFEMNKDDLKNIIKNSEVEYEWNDGSYFMVAIPKDAKDILKRIKNDHKERKIDERLKVDKY
jgi:hypothetical protein